MTFKRFLTVLLMALLGPAAAAQAQSDKLSLFVGEPDGHGGVWQKLEIVEAASFDAVPHVTGAPFLAHAVTEFTQVLGDGNRIERRYESLIARDGRGRTRREEEIVLVGPLATPGPAPKLVTIVDPDGNVSFTLDERLRVAHRNQLAIAFNGESAKIARRAAPGAPAAVAKKLEADADSARITTESLGRRTIEGVMAEGSRTTSTIPAGAVGNLQPIEIVSDRWFSPELQMPVLISRRDPRVGDTVYRLINVVRAEPPAHLFTVPLDYEIREGKLAVWKIFELKSTNAWKKK
jgi:hypothetical protein